MLNMFIVMPMTSGAMVTTLVATGIAVVCVICAAVFSRISFGSSFKGN